MGTLSGSLSNADKEQLALFRLRSWLTDTLLILSSPVCIKVSPLCFLLQFSMYSMT